MKQYLEQFFKEYEWPGEAGKAVLGFCEKFWQNKRLGRLLEKDMEIYGQNVEADCTAMGTELVAEAEKEGLNPWETWPDSFRFIISSVDFPKKFAGSLFLI